ncbi:hypothetical protein [Streptomyces radicis]|uniref:hypothetical protein n=1 Tax=Streptomyces radicis TaxID=1750517 RepID=UPI00160018C0|nr:hypothetical protein [Streptomyces radicis]
MSLAPLPADVRALLTALIEALDVPLSADPGDDGRAVEGLLRSRAAWLSGYLSGAAQGGETLPLERLATGVRDVIEHFPVTYTPYESPEGSMRGGSGRCASAHPEDASPCVGPHEAVTVLDPSGTRVTGCEHHATRLLASLERAQVVSGSVPGAAIRVFKAASSLPPFAWREGDTPPRTAVHASPDRVHGDAPDVHGRGSGVHGAPQGGGRDG